MWLERVNGVCFYWEQSVVLVISLLFLVRRVLFQSISSLPASLRFEGVRTSCDVSLHAELFGPVSTVRSRR